MIWVFHLKIYDLMILVVDRSPEFEKLKSRTTGCGFLFIELFGICGVLLMFITLFKYFYNFNFTIPNLIL
jgi:hypothetical protein